MTQPNAQSCTLEEPRCRDQECAATASRSKLRLYANPPSQRKSPSSIQHKAPSEGGLEKLGFGLLKAVASSCRRRRCVPFQAGNGTAATDQSRPSGNS